MEIRKIHKLKLPNQYKIKGLNWLLNRLVKKTENLLIRRAEIHSCVKPGNREEKVILSMTTYPARNEKVVWTIKSLLNQNTSIDRFILWLAEEQYPDQVIPKAIADYQKYGLEIQFCDDIKSHKKYYYTMMENPDALVITVDDDVIYPEDTIQKLLVCHKKYPNAVICNSARWIKINNNKFASYIEWNVNIPVKIKEPDYKILPIGEGGVLYPVNSFNSCLFDKSVIMSEAVSADDLWLKFMAVKHGTKAMVSEKLQRGLCEVTVKNGEKSSLNAINVAGGNNDVVIKKLNRRFPEVLKRIQE